MSDLTCDFTDRAWRAKAIQAIDVGQQWRFIATGRAARRLAPRVERLLSKEKLGVLDALKMFGLRGFPAVFFYATGRGYTVRRLSADGPDTLLLEFEPSSTQANFSRTT